MIKIKPFALFFIFIINFQNSVAFSQSVHQTDTPRLILTETDNPYFNKQCNSKTNISYFFNGKPNNIIFKPYNDDIWDSKNHPLSMIKLSISAKSNIQIFVKKNINTYCIKADKIDIEFEITPNIILPSEFKSSFFQCINESLIKKEAEIAPYYLNNTFQNKPIMTNELAMFKNEIFPIFSNNENKSEYQKKLLEQINSHIKSFEIKNNNSLQTLLNNYNKQRNPSIYQHCVNELDHLNQFLETQKK